MPYTNDDDDRLSITAARSKLALLQDLFTGAGFGTHLDLGERALDGLTTILREIGVAMEHAETLGSELVAAAPELRDERTTH